MFNISYYIHFPFVHNILFNIYYQVKMTSGNFDFTFNSR